MSIWFARLLIFLTICLAVAQAYPATMSKQKWLQEHVALHPTLTFEISPDRVETDFNDDDGAPAWLFRSRKFCCAPPL